MVFWMSADMEGFNLSINQSNKGSLIRVFIVTESLDTPKSILKTKGLIRLHQMCMLIRSLAGPMSYGTFSLTDSLEHILMWRNKKLGF